jgi:Flp pilus assembly protein TadG
MHVVRNKAMRWSRDEGNASVEFALVAPLLMLIGIAVLQLMLALHIRTVITSAAIEGARVGALVGSDLVTAEQRTREVLLANIAGTTVANVHASRTTLAGVPMIAVQVDAELPLLGVYGPTTMSLTGHAYVE